MRIFLLFIIFGTILISCKKQDSNNGSALWKQYKDSLAGTYTWQYYIDQTPKGMPLDSVRQADTTFPVTMINDFTLSICNHPLIYSDSIYYAYPGYGYINDTANSLYYFDRSFFNPGHTSSTFMYDRRTGSAAFIIEQGGLQVKYKQIFYTRIR